MKKGVLKRTPKHKIKRCSSDVQRLKDSVLGSVSSDYLSEALEKIRELPILNKEAIWIRNRQGVLVEIVGKHGSSRKYNVDYKGGVWYFDGNLLGKRKLKMVQAFFNDNIIREIPINQHDTMDKVWKKFTAQGRL